MLRLKIDTGDCLLKPSLNRLCISLIDHMQERAEYGTVPGAGLSENRSGGIFDFKEWCAACFLDCRGIMKFMSAPKTSCRAEGGIGEHGAGSVAKLAFRLREAGFVLQQSGHPMGDSVRIR